MQLPRAADISVCFSCAKGWDGYPLTKPLKGGRPRVLGTLSFSVQLRAGIGFRCFCCDKHCYGVRYQLAEDGRMWNVVACSEAQPSEWIKVHVETGFKKICRPSNSEDSGPSEGGFSRQASQTLDLNLARLRS